jgi:hypothetical protein
MAITAVFELHVTPEALDHGPRAELLAVLTQFTAADAI